MPIMDEYLLPVFGSMASDYSFCSQSIPLSNNNAYYHDSLQLDPLFTNIAPLPELPSSAPVIDFNLELPTSIPTTINYSHVPIPIIEQPRLELKQPLASKSILSLPETDADEAWEPADIHQIGYRDDAGNWRCAFAGCQSSRIFVRACDLRKHYRGHERPSSARKRSARVLVLGSRPAKTISDI
jgi:hypothetical protein